MSCRSPKDSVCFNTFYQAHGYYCNVIACWPSLEEYRNDHALPYLIGRIDHQVTVLKRVMLTVRQRPSDYLRMIYLDAVNALPAVIRFGIDLVGPERMLYSSDHPWVSPKIIDNVRSLKLSAEPERMVFAENARKLFQL
jgi:aminocarboxymuconate-semialdehyde decarboxylase